MYIFKQCCDKISIHAPRAGSDLIRQYSLFGRGRFQSTLPVRGATLKVDVGSSAY